MRYIAKCNLLFIISAFTAAAVNILNYFVRHRFFHLQFYRFMIKETFFHLTVVLVVFGGAVLSAGVVNVILKKISVSKLYLFFIRTVLCFIVGGLLFTVPQFEKALPFILTKMFLYNIQPDVLLLYRNIAFLIFLFFLFLPRVGLGKARLFIIILLLYGIGGYYVYAPFYRNNKNIILILVDNLRADKLGCYGSAAGLTPFIDSLAAHGTVCKNHFSAGNGTSITIPTLLTSRYPDELLNPVNVAFNYNIPPELVTLPELLSQTGYYTACISGYQILGKYNNFDYGFDYLRFVNMRNDHYAVTETEQLLDKISSRNFFLYIHMMATHEPYDKHGIRPLILEDKLPVPGDRPLTQAEISQWIDNGIFFNFTAAADFFPNNIITVSDIQAVYNYQVAQADRNIRKIVDALKKNNILKDTIICITSDHGTSIFEDGTFQHGVSLMNHNIKVPLVMYGIDGMPGTIKTNTVSLDIMPTIAALAAAEEEYVPYRGVNLCEPVLPRSIYGYTYEMNGFYLIKDPYKIIVDSGTVTACYDLRHDGQETENLLGKDESFRGIARDILQTKPVITKYYYTEELPRETINDRGRKIFKALGYLQ